VLRGVRRRRALARKQRTWSTSLEMVISSDWATSSEGGLVILSRYCAPLKLPWIFKFETAEMSK
jgi:hypothetical protein